MTSSEKGRVLGRVRAYIVFLKLSGHCADRNIDISTTLKLVTQGKFRHKVVFQRTQLHEGVILRGCGLFSSLPTSSFVLDSLLETFNHTVTTDLDTLRELPTLW